MSRIGKLLIKIPAGVTIDVKPDHHITVKGSKGELSMAFNPKIEVDVTDGVIACKRKNDGQEARSLHGLTRTLIANMIEGVTKGFQKQLDIQGVGYRAALAGTKLVLNLGYSHPIEITPPKGITVTIDAEKKNILTISGINKQGVGELAAKIRSLRKPEPYKGKGIRYLGEYIARKAGKAAAKEK